MLLPHRQRAERCVACNSAVPIVCLGLPVFANGERDGELRSRRRQKELREKLESLRDRRSSLQPESDGEDLSYRLTVDDESEREAWLAQLELDSIHVRLAALSRCFSYSPSDPCKHASVELVAACELDQLSLGSQKLRSLNFPTQIREKRCTPEP